MFILRLIDNSGTEYQNFKELSKKYSISPVLFLSEYLGFALKIPNKELLTLQENIDVIHEIIENVREQEKNMGIKTIKKKNK